MIANVSDYLPTWKEFMNMKENKKLQINEAKQKYLKLQAQHNYLMEAQVAAYNAVSANSVMDGADAVMLSAETSVGNYPVEVINAMSSII